MSKPRWNVRTRTTRWLVCCFLLVAVPVYGLSALVTSFLGPVHFHQPLALSMAGGPQDAMQGWHDFRRFDHVTDSVYHVHSHNGLGMHRHDPRDGSVITVGTDERSGGADGPVSGGAAVLAVSETMTLPSAVITVALVSWKIPNPCSFLSCDLRRLDRPPSA